MKCQHALDFEACLICRDEAYIRAGAKPPDDRLEISKLLQWMRYDPKKNSDARIARLLQAAATLTASGHTRADAVLTVFELEKQVIETLKKSQDLES